MANGTISGNGGSNAVTLTNATDGSGVPSQNGSDVTVTTSNATVSGSGSFYNVTFSGGTDILVAENMPWVDPDAGASVAFDSINMGTGDDSVSLDRSGFKDLSMGSGADTLELINSGGQSANLGGNDDIAVLDLSGVSGMSEEELAQKDGQPLLDLDGGSGDDTLDLKNEWTVTLSSGDVTIDPGNDGIDVTVSDTFTSEDYKHIVGFPSLLDGTVQWADQQTLSGGEVVHAALEFSNFEAIDAVCFTEGTNLKTPKGEVAIETLRKGDLVITQNGAMPIRWLGKRRLDVVDLMANPKLLPVRIPSGALGINCPKRDLSLSPQHRVVIASKIAERMFGKSIVLAPAKHLVGLNGIHVDGDVREVVYFHMMLETHEIVYADDLATETLLPGQQALKMLPRSAVLELRAVFPDIDKIMAQPDKHAALPILKGRDSRNLLARICKNGQPLKQS